ESHARTRHTPTCGTVPRLLKRGTVPNAKQAAARRHSPGSLAIKLRYMGALAFRTVPLHLSLRSLRSFAAINPLIHLVAAFLQLAPGRQDNPLILHELNDIGIDRNIQIRLARFARGRDGVEV